VTNNFYCLFGYTFVILILFSVDTGGENAKCVTEDKDYDISTD
jgi:hypothetical protein